jgi:predicted transcriptional regulator
VIKDATLTIRLPQELKDAIARVAEAEQRSIGQVITMAMTAYLESIGEWKAAGSGRRGARPKPRAKRK